MIPYDSSEIVCIYRHTRSGLASIMTEFHYKVMFSFNTVYKNSTVKIQKRGIGVVWWRTRDSLTHVSQWNEY